MLAIRNNYLHKRLPKYLLNLHETAPTGPGQLPNLFFNLHETAPTGLGTKIVIFFL